MRFISSCELSQTEWDLDYDLSEKKTMFAFEIEHVFFVRRAEKQFFGFAPRRIVPVQSWL